ncbi:hypothetical protein DAPPUDRAFT_336811 [Daphnia pulex]|uniref:Uncharacterized protein n=1 Tax=Daphnia pulex TaxID=6669 RepID=E9I0E7_DAPPU|nr:hypothetical protein DAPPUDRAFT_336811 [Daphnia pulex]|eukprot:EFX62534.1 hypothetical protein DAPPUDRAFT_336811 [Daphnia pulex]
MPTIIPLDDVTGNPKSVYDHRHRPWPEAKIGTHHNVAVYTSTTAAPDKAEEAPKDFDFKPSINQDCPEEERADIEETLRENVDCFARDGIADIVKVNTTESLCRQYEELKYYDATLLTMSK